MQDLKVIENELVPVYATDTGEKVVYGTELHSVLGVKTPYRIWIGRRLEECEAAENEDYSSEQICTVVGGAPRKEHIIKLDTAKEMAMLERNEKGKQVRRYFIKVEKKYRESTKQKKIPQARKKALSSANMLVKTVSSIFKDAGVDPVFIAAEAKRLYKEQAGVDINIPLITDSTTQKLYDCTTLAKELGILSANGNPHGQAIGAILQKLNIQESEIVKTAFSRNGHEGVTIQYKPSVLDSIKRWLEENNYPTKIPAAGKSYTVVYREVA